MKQSLDRFRALEKRARVSIIVILLAIVLGGGLIGGGQYLLGEWQKDLFALRSALGAVQAETTRLREDITFVTENTGAYESVLADGMFTERDRLAARRALEAEVRATRVQGDIVMQPEVQREPADRALANDFTVYETPVQFTAEAMLDADVYAMARELVTALPGFLVLQSVQLQRVPEITAEDLETLRNGQAVPLVTGQFVYAWRTAGMGAADVKEDGRR